MVCRVIGVAAVGLVLFLSIATGRGEEPSGSSAVGPGRWLTVHDFGALGREYSSHGWTTAGSPRVTVEKPGDLQVGQWVTVSRCNPHQIHGALWGPRKNYAASRAVGKACEVRGYDGRTGGWYVLILDVEPSAQPAFRWTDDLGRTWHPKQPITHDWQSLGNGIEVRFNELDWSAGYSVSMVYRDQLLSKITKIEGTTLILDQPATRAATDATVRRCDGPAIQTAVDRAIKEKAGVYLPPGRYTLASTVQIRNPEGLTIRGADGVNSVVDIRDGEGACFQSSGGTEFTLRDLALEGHTGFEDRDIAGAIRTLGGTALWGFYFKYCAGFCIRGTERVLVENCHARRMSGECFYSQGPGRWGTREPAKYTKSITYLRCTAEDLARNAFNNNDFAENTSVLYCRIRNVGGCTWEGASRFVRFVGNYVRNSGTVAMGNINSRAPELEQLGSGQHLVADNVFESGVCYGGCAIRSTRGASQVIVRNNLFVNYGTSAVEIVSAGDTRCLPAANTTITGNQFDMTLVDDLSAPSFTPAPRQAGTGPTDPKAKPPATAAPVVLAKPKLRTAILINADETIVADNQIYVRGLCDPSVTGIRILEPCMNLVFHDNLIRNCGAGLAVGRTFGLVDEAVAPDIFRPKGATLPLVGRMAHGYRGWTAAWLTAGKPTERSTIEAMDPQTQQFRLREPRAVKPGDRFEVIAACPVNWMIHHNTITGCASPMLLEGYGNAQAVFRDNLVTRGDATGVKVAVTLGGQFRFSQNELVGFDEPGSCALLLNKNPLGDVCRSELRQNRFERCTLPVREGQPGLWSACRTDGNETLDCPAGLPEVKK